VANWRLKASLSATDTGGCQALGLTKEATDILLISAGFGPEHDSAKQTQPQSTPRPPLQRPPRAFHFTGRADELRRLIDQLQPGAVVTLCGPGGVGKTALAAEAIWALAPGDEPPARFPDGVLFHTFYHQPQAALALEAIARAYGEEPRPTPQDAARRALSGRAALLVLDGAEAADDLGAVLSVAGGCGVLVTSRRHADAPVCWQDVAPLPNPEAVQLLQAWGGVRAADQAAAGRICTLVGRFRSPCGWRGATWRGAARGRPTTWPGWRRRDWRRCISASASATACRCCWSGASPR